MKLSQGNIWRLGRCGKAEASFWNWVLSHGFLSTRLSWPLTTCGLDVTLVAVAEPSVSFCLCWAAAVVFPRLLLMLLEKTPALTNIGVWQSELAAPRAQTLHLLPFFLYPDHLLSSNCPHYLLLQSLQCTTSFSCCAFTTSPLLSLTHNTWGPVLCNICASCWRWSLNPCAAGSLMLEAQSFLTWDKQGIQLESWLHVRPCQVNLGLLGAVKVLAQ